MAGGVLRGRPLRPDGGRGRTRPHPGIRGPRVRPTRFRRCSTADAGKDRTGVLSALILAFLGVSDEVIVEDYALSAAAMADLLEHLKAEYPDSVEQVEQHAPAILRVMPDTMEQFLALVRAGYGSYRGLADSLGVAGAVERLRQAVLVTP